MLGAGVDLELRDLLPREPVLREHPFDRDAEHLGRAAVELLAERAALEPARIAGVAGVAPLVELFSPRPAAARGSSSRSPDASARRSTAGRPPRYRAAQARDGRSSRSPRPGRCR